MYNLYIEYSCISLSFLMYNLYIEYEWINQPSLLYILYPTYSTYVYNQVFLFHSSLEH